MSRLLIDADGCPVKPEAYRVAQRHALSVVVVANTWLAVPAARWIELVVVSDRADAADDWIAAHAGPGDIVVTADIPLAARCVAGGASVLDPRGREFTEHSIGEALANREIGEQLRAIGAITRGPAPLERQDRSRFLQRLDELVRTIARRGGK
ncbi:MAG: YaiI/YqxD family protein [Planctomycetota bacterium]